MPRPSGNENGDAGPFPTPVCPENRGHSGGGKTPPPTVPQCNMMVLQRELNGRNPATAQFTRGAEQNRRRIAEEELM